MLRKSFTLFCLLIPIFLLGNSDEKPWTTPWFTGPLLVNSGATTPKGVVTWEFFMQLSNTYGQYDKHWNPKNVDDLWSVQPVGEFLYGINSFMDIEFVFQASYNTRKNVSSTRLNDTNFYLGFQALRQKKGTWIPDLRIALQEIFPTGQYDKFSAKKLGTDQSGYGSFQTGINLNFQKLFEMASEQYFRLYLSFNYLFPAPTHIKGISAYGGVSETRGKVIPGQNFTGFLSGEYTITRNWVFAFDIEYVFSRHDRFSGERGSLATGEKAQVGSPVSQQISFAPAIEYNFRENFGLIGGVWFTLAGKNSTQFVTGIFAVLISY